MDVVKPISCAGNKMPLSDEAFVYFYRASSFYMGGTHPTIYMDDKKYFNLGNGRCSAIKVTPGLHNYKIGKNFTWSFKDIVSQVNAEGGKKYYVRVSLGLDSMSTTMVGFEVDGQLNVGLVQEEVAVKEISSILSSQ